MASQLARLLGLAIVILELKRLGLRHWEPWLLWGALFVALGTLVRSRPLDTLSVCIQHSSLRKTPRTQVSLGMRQVHSNRVTALIATSFFSTAQGVGAVFCSKKQ